LAGLQAKEDGLKCNISDAFRRKAAYLTSRGASGAKKAKVEFLSLFIFVSRKAYFLTVLIQIISGALFILAKSHFQVDRNDMRSLLW
jgi:hypothetical protein